MLPVTPAGAAPGYSPYSSDSAMAGNPYLVSLEILAEEGLLTKDEIQGFEECERLEGFEGRRKSRNTSKAAKANLSASGRFREERLRWAFARFAKLNGQVHRGLEEFCEQQKDWLDDYTLYSALKAAHGGTPWYGWEKGLKERQADALSQVRQELAGEIEFYQFVQYQFARQWKSFREYCAERGVGLIGDVPIFVAHDSVDVWVHRHLFDLDRYGHPSRVTGYPPDMFNSDGQKWGHPHFVWDQHKAENYRWWWGRFKTTLEKFDVVRIDHFIGFDRCWAIPASCPNAAKGKWIAGGGPEFFAAIHKQLGEGKPFIVEDLGDLIPSAIALRDRFNLPGMRVLQMGFDDSQYHRPHSYPRRCVAYTGTHDNDTTVGWYEKLIARAKSDVAAKAELHRVNAYLGIENSRDLHWACIRSLYASQANTVIVPMQDLLGLDTRSRMNIPGTCDGQWVWRLADKALNAELAQKMRNMAGLFGRM
jgi:4-alpha-glucanotransferase